MIERQQHLIRADRTGIGAMADFTVDNWSVSPQRNTVSRNGIDRRLEPRVMDLLCYLARRAGQVVSRDELIEAVWPHAYVTDSALQSAVSMLRKALEDDPRRPSILETIPKRGYRLIASSSAAKPVVAVLPFDNRTGLAAQQHLVDGLTDALIAELGRHAAISVISRQSVMAFRGSSLPLPQIAAKLGATIIVEGSVHSGPNPLSTSVQLVDANSDTHVWAENIQLVPDRLFDQLREVAAEIAQQLPAGFTETPSVGPRNEPNPDPEALNHYLLGRYHWCRLSPEHIRSALEHFEKAIEIDPGFSAAHAGIADVWGALGYWGQMPASEVKDKARGSIERALAIDPHSAEAQMLAGAYSLHCSHDWQAARARLEKAIDCNPSLAHARLLYGLCLGTMGDKGARDQLRKAQQLDPLNPATQFAAAVYAAFERRTDVAEQYLRRALELDPGFPPGHELRADLSWLDGAEDAMPHERHIWRGDKDIDDLLGAADPGGPGKLLAAAQLLEGRSRSRYTSPRMIARLYSLAGDSDSAIDVLSRALDEDDLMQPDLVCMMPAFEPVRRNPRFRKLLGRLGLRPVAP